MAGNLFERVQQSSTEAKSPGFSPDKQSLHLGMSGRDHEECDGSEKLSVTTCRQKSGLIRPKNIRRDQMIAFSRVQCLQIIV